jgi:hypothetical protein
VRVLGLVPEPELGEQACRAGQPLEDEQGYRRPQVAFEAEKDAGLVEQRRVEGRAQPQDRVSLGGDVVEGQLVQAALDGELRQAERRSRALHRCRETPRMG